MRSKFSPPFPAPHRRRWVKNMNNRISITVLLMLDTLVTATIAGIVFLLSSMLPWFPWFEPHTFAAGLAIIQVGLPALIILGIVGILLHKPFSLPWATGVIPFVVLGALVAPYALGKVVQLPKWPWSETILCVTALGLLLATLGTTILHARTVLKRKCTQQLRD